MKENVVQATKNHEEKDTNNRKVFVYGTLKKGHPNSYLLETSELLGTFKTKPVFTMYSLGMFPAISLVGKTAISGEVYSVDEDTFKRLDILEGYPSFYNRTKIDTTHGEAWVYFLDDREGITVVESGEW